MYRIKLSKLFMFTLLFAPKWLPTVFAPRSLALSEAGLTNKREVCAPLENSASSLSYGDFQSPHRTTAGSRPWTPDRRSEVAD